MKTELKLSLVQYQILYNQSYSSFLKRIESEVKIAVANKSKLVVFPELVTYDMLPTFKDTKTRKLELENLAAEFSEKYFFDVQKLTRNYEVSILAGSTPVKNEIGKIKNRAALFFCDQSPHFQDKNFLTPDEKNYDWCGDANGIYTVDAPWGRTAIVICYDCEFAQHSASLAKAKPELIIVPSMTSNAHGRNRVLWTAKARAIEHFAYVVVTGTAGKNGDQFGQACLITPQEGEFPQQVLTGAENQHSQLNGELDFKRLREHRSKALIYPSRDFILREQF